MKLRRIHLASTAAVGVLVLVGFSNQAYAGAFAYSDLELSAFEAQTVNGNTLGGTPNGEMTNSNTATGGVAGGNISVTGATDTFGATASIGFGAPASSGNVPAPAGECVGTCPAPFTFANPPPIGNFSQAATSLTNAPVISVTPPPNEVGSPNPSTSGGATAKTVAQSQITGANFAGAQSSIGLNAGFSFKLLTAQVVDLSFTALLQKVAGLDSTGFAALADSSWSLTIRDTGPTGTSTATNVLVWNPTGNAATDATGIGGVACGTSGSGCQVIHDPFSLNAPNPSLDTPSVGRDTIGPETGLFEIQAALNNVDIYQLAISHTVDTSVTSLAVVPEPGSVALLAAGLLGFGGLARRRRRKA